MTASGEHALFINKRASFALSRDYLGTTCERYFYEDIIPWKPRPLGFDQCDILQPNSAAAKTTSPSSRCLAVPAALFLPYSPGIGDHAFSALPPHPTNVRQPMPTLSASYDPRKS